MNGYQGNFKAHMQNSPFSVVSKYGQTMAPMGSHPNASHGAAPPATGGQQAGTPQKQAPSQQPYQQIHPKAGHVPTSAQGSPPMHRPVVQAHPAQQNNHAVPDVHTSQSGPPSWPPASVAGQMSPSQGIVSQAPPPVAQRAPQPSAAEDKTLSSVPVPAPAKPAAPKVHYKVSHRHTDAKIWAFPDDLTPAPLT